MEDFLLAQIDVRNALAKLPPVDRELVMLVYQIHQPDDWTYPWPPKTCDIGTYIGLKFDGRALSEATVRYRKKVAIQVMGGHRELLKPKRRGVND